MYTIPASLVADWSAQKKHLLADMEKNAKNSKSANVRESAKKTLPLTTQLFSECDQALKKKMTVAANAKTDDAARKAAIEVHSVAKKYLQIFDKHAKQHPLLPLVGARGVLEDIVKHAEASMKSRAPQHVDVRPPFAAALLATENALPVAERRPFKNKLLTLNQDLAGPLATLNNARSDAEAYVAAKAIREQAVLAAAAVAAAGVQLGWSAATQRSLAAAYAALDVAIAAVVRRMEA